jgi:hypothetical protein
MTCFDDLPPTALAAVHQVAAELTIRESLIFLDGREFTGEPPGLPPSNEANYARLTGRRPHGCAAPRRRQSRICGTRLPENGNLESGKREEISRNPGKSK